MDSGRDHHALACKIPFLAKVIVIGGVVVNRDERREKTGVDHALAKPSRTVDQQPRGSSQEWGIDGVSALTLAAPFHTNPKRQRG
jgi:hypothetical protein